MKKILVLGCALACLAAAPAPSQAQDRTVVRTESPEGSRTVVRKRSPYGMTKKVVRTDRMGCRTKTVKRTNGMGDSVTRSRSSC